MNSTAEEYDAASRPLSIVLNDVPTTGWLQPSPCEGWSARDVLGHLIDTQRDFLANHGVDLGSLPEVADDPVAAWRDHADRVLAAISDDALTETAFDSHFGPTTVGAAFEHFYVWDMVVHRWDIARSVGLDAGLSDAELERIEQGADRFGEALYMEGVCRPGLEVSEDADRTARLLARLGRIT